MTSDRSIEGSRSPRVFQNEARALFTSRRGLFRSHLMLSCSACVLRGMPCRACASCVCCLHLKIHGPLVRRRQRADVLRGRQVQLHRGLHLERGKAVHRRRLQYAGKPQGSARRNHAHGPCLPVATCNGGSERGWTRGAIECPVGKECYGFVGKGGECQAIVHPSRAQQLPLSFCTPRGLFSGNAHGQAHGGAPACDHHQRRHGHQVVHLPQDRRLHPAWPHIPRKKRCWERVGAFQLIFQHHSFFCSLLFHLLKWFRYFVPTCAPPMSLPSRCLACVLVSLHSTSGDAGDRR